MLSSTLGHSQASRQAGSQVLTFRPQTNFPLHHKHQPTQHALTSRSHRENNYQLSRTHAIPLSSRGKQNDPTIKDFSILIHTTFTKKPSLTKRNSFSKQIQLAQSNINFQRACLTQSSPSSRSYRDSSRSNSKRKKKTQHLFNFTARNTSKQRQSTNTTRQNTLKDSYINSFLSTNKSQFISTSNSQFKNQQVTQKNSQNYNQSNQYEKEKNQNSGFILKQTNYEKIRQKMKKLKNMTQVRQFKRKPVKHKTTEQEWNEIEKAVRMVCREEMKRVDTDETLETQMRTSINNQDQEGEKVIFGNDEIEEDQKEKQNILLEDNKTASDISQQQMANETNEQVDEVQIKVGQKVQIRTQQNLIPLQNTQNSKSIPSPHIQNEKSPKPQSPSTKNPSALSYAQFSSLLLIYQHALYMVPSIISKVTQICQSHQLDFQLPIFLFFKQMCLNKKLIETAFDQQGDGFFTQHNVYDYSDVIKQIKKANAKNIVSLVDLKPNINDVKQFKISNESCLSLLMGKQSIEALNESINSMKKDFQSLNMKLIKKLLKKISKSATTNTKQFQVFLNYCSCFLNLSLVHQTIEKVLNSSINFVKSDKNSSCRQKEQHQIKEFLYKDCGFIENKYLAMKQKVFEMCFDIQEEHNKIETYYHELIKELKSCEQKFQGEK